MKVIEPEVWIRANQMRDLVQYIELAGRTCYKSEDRITDDSADDFVKSKVLNGHVSIIEHEHLQVKFICDRGITHEIVRHRLAAYSQESTRYCNYAKDKFGNELTFIRPFFFDVTNEDKESETYGYKDIAWRNVCQTAENYYLRLIELGANPQEARSVLPNSLKTEIVTTYDIREWRNVFNQRCAKTAHLQMRQIMIPLLLEFKRRLPVLFDDIQYDKEFPAEHYAAVKYHNLRGILTGYTLEQETGMVSI